MKNSFFAKLIVAGLIVVSATACKTTSHTTVTSDVAGPTVIQKPVVADLEVGEARVKGTATAKGSTPISEVKELAVLDAVTKANVDVLVEPRYDITKSFRKVTVDVSGYPAKYKNFRPMEAQDTIFIDNTQLSTTAGKRKLGSGTNKRKRNTIIGVSAGGLAAAVGAFFLLFW